MSAKARGARSPRAAPATGIEGSPAPLVGSVGKPEPANGRFFHDVFFHPDKEQIDRDTKERFYWMGWSDAKKALALGGLHPDPKAWNFTMFNGDRSPGLAFQKGWNDYNQDPLVAHPPGRPAMPAPGTPLSQNKPERVHTWDLPANESMPPFHPGAT